MTINSGDRQLLPIACTLGAADGAQRLAEWRQLSATAAVGRQHTQGQLTIRFRDVAGVREELDRLVAAERDCCAFLGWELVQADGEWHLHITGSDDELRTVVLH